MTNLQSNPQFCNVFSQSLPCGPATLQTAFCHRRLEPVTSASCAACFADDDRAQTTYGSRSNCDAANTTPTSPSLVSGPDNAGAADETVQRALTLGSFDPIERLIREHCYTGPDVVRALGRERHREWLRAVVELCGEEVS